MRNFLFVLVGVVVASTAAVESAISEDDKISNSFDDWLAKHNKAYNGDEKKQRLQIFKENLAFIDKHNMDKTKTFKLDVTKFADLTHHEFKTTYLSCMVESEGRIPRIPNPRYLFNQSDELDKSINWNEKGAVTSVKDQGTWKTSWAFSAIAAVEGINKIKTGTLTPLSVQELLKYDTFYKHGCCGFKDYAFHYIINNRGIHSEEDYNDNCCDNRKKDGNVVTIDTYEYVPTNDEMSLQKAVSKQPISVSIDASAREFQHYKSGVLKIKSGLQLNHAVIIVGYDTEKDVGEYWLIKNSWGDDWGEKGYIKMKRNVEFFEGMCGIAMRACYPVKKMKRVFCFDDDEKAVCGEEGASPELK